MSELSTSPEVKPRAPGFREVLSNRNYRWLLLAQLVSDLGDGVYALSLLWAMKTLTGSGVQMSLVLTAELVPMIVIGIFAGVFVDRGRKKMFLLAADICRGIIVGGLALLWWSGMLMPWMIITAAALLASFSAFFTPARAVSIRTLVPADSMMQAQSLSQTTQTVVGLCAPAIAAVLLSIDVGLAFLINCFSFFISFLFIAMIRHEDLMKKQEGRLDFQGLRASLKEGFRTILNVPILRNLIIYLILLNFMFAPISVLIPLYADNPTELATYSTAFFAGLLGGSILVGFFSKMRKIVPITIGLLALLLSFGALSYVDQFYLAAACLLVGGMGTPMANVTLSTLFVTIVPREVLGRASSMVRVLTQSASPLSLSMTGSLLLIWNVRELFFAISVFGLLIVVLMLLNPTIRRTE